MEAPVLSIEKVSKSFGKRKALDNVSLCIEKGEIFGLLGPNGAGKSTLARIATGVLEPDQGRVMLFGRAFGKNKIVLSKKIGVVPQEISLYQKFGVEGNIRFFGSLYGLTRDELNAGVASALKDFNLIDFQGTAIEHLSGGYKRLANIACSVVHQPEIIFLDEPT
ncbi:MAG: ABC transporter ATP-binding protein, partial [Candidatus Diapherotrites archaeon]|nr:ABC transporter ATP-binding protein [Candidatus Diapherotrites archaeon]